jgi:hypothetical protein
VDNASRVWAPAYGWLAAAHTYWDPKKTAPEKRPQPAAKYPGSGH